MFMNDIEINPGIVFAYPNSVDLELCLPNDSMNALEID